MLQYFYKGGKTMEKYSEQDKKAIAVLVGRLFVKAKRMGYTYRQMKVLVKARSHVTIYRWFHGISYPSQSHIYHIKKFLGYIKV